ncbi:MAG: hypothetical protein JXM73_16450 [Anaerolineae bacterium]|nr:hypothetical protein [Anaerolineae bacterium]
MSEEPRKYRDEKDEKDEKEEKNRNESWEEKWRRDPVDAAVWALILIWVGVVWLAHNAGWIEKIVEEPEKAWAIGFLGAGAIVLLGVVLRLVVPAYRRPIIGSLIFGAILFGIGLTQLMPGVAVGAIILIGIGVIILLAGIFRPK